MCCHATFYRAEAVSCGSSTALADFRLPIMELVRRMFVGRESTYLGRTYILPACVYGWG